MDRSELPSALLAASRRCPRPAGTLAGLKRRLAGRSDPVKAQALLRSRVERKKARLAKWLPASAAFPSTVDLPTGPFGSIPILSGPYVFDLPKLGQPAQGHAPAVTPAFRFAVNTVSFETGEVRYGGLPDMIRDISKLGAEVVRHPGRIQMFIDHLLPLVETTSTGNPRPDLTPIKPTWVDPEVLLPLVTTSESFQALERTVRALHGKGVSSRLMITLFDLGAGGSPPWGKGQFAGTGDTAPIGARHLDPIGVAWSEGNYGQHVEDPLTGEKVIFAGGVDASSADDAQKWARYTLDPADAYKRVFFHALSAAVGRAFAGLYRHLWLDAGIDLSAYIEGVEICNEIEVLHVLRGGGSTASRDAQVDPDSWGDFYYACARGLRDACDWLPIWLPGIASYTESKGGAATWAQKESFLDGILQRIRERVTTDFGEAKADTVFPDLVAGVDYHWYHFGEGTTVRENALPLILLELELRRLREILDGYVPGALLSVVETSVNTVCGTLTPTTESDVTEGGLVLSLAGGAGCEAGSVGIDYSPSYRPDRWNCDCRGADCAHTVVNRVDDFQAASVWMRMVVALVGGVDLAGWHTHIGNPGAAFRGCGLRMDFDPVELANQAWPRKSWFAFQRLTQVLRTVTGARVMNERYGDLRSVSVSAVTLAYDGGTLSPSDLVWVVELPGASWPGSLPKLASKTGSAWWAYLGFIDPGSEAGTRSPSCARIRLSTRALAGTPAVFQVPIGPRDGTLLDIPVALGRSYPTRIWRGDVARPVLGTPSDDGTRTVWKVDLAHGDWPVLLLSTQRLPYATVTIVDDGT